MQVVGGFRTPADWRPRLLSSRNNPWSRRLTSAGSPRGTDGSGGVFQR